MLVCNKRLESLADIEASSFDVSEVIFESGSWRTSYKMRRNMFHWFDHVIFEALSVLSNNVFCYWPTTDMTLSMVYYELALVLYGHMELSESLLNILARFCKA